MFKTNLSTTFKSNNQHKIKRIHKQHCQTIRIITILTIPIYFSAIVVIQYVNLVGIHVKIVVIQLEERVQKFVHATVIVIVIVIVMAVVNVINVENVLKIVVVHFFNA